jgi:hypothetical protein
LARQDVHEECSTMLICAMIKIGFRRWAAGVIEKKLADPQADGIHVSHGCDLNNLHGLYMLSHNAMIFAGT